jgi:hypothetical protein
LTCIQHEYKQKMIDEKSIDDVIQFTIKSLNNLNQEETDRVTDLIVSIISHLVLFYFEKMDKLVDSFVRGWGTFFIKNFEEEEFQEYQLEAFSALLLSNTQLFHEIFFPNVNIQGIETKLQVETLLRGKYFRLVTQRKFSQDLSFHFE